VFRTSEIGIRELDHRRNDGIEVTLFWNSRTDAIFIVVEDEQDGIAFELEVDAAQALEAFRHPYAYAQRDREDQALAA
jgi:hypothetical protein